MDILLNIAIESALKAGDSIMDIYNSEEDFNIEIKRDNSPLTRADVKSHNVITSYLEKTEIPVLSEEGNKTSYEEREKWSRLWIVDPIDGTKEFIKKNGEFTVNIALVENQELLLGVVYAPALGDLYFSSKGKGAFKVSVSKSYNVDVIKADANKLPLIRDNKTYTVVASRSHMSPETETYINDLRAKYGDVELISKGSSLKLCMVAEGAADCYPRFAPTMEWDTAAGQAICEHAGFSVLDFKSKETMKYNRRNLLNDWFIVK